MPRFKEYGLHDAWVMPDVRDFVLLSYGMETLNKAFPFMVLQGSPERSRRALQPHSRRYAHERKQQLAVRSSRLRSGQAQSLSKD
jgi:hypothetical protein